MFLRGCEQGNTDPRSTPYHIYIYIYIWQFLVCSLARKWPIAHAQMGPKWAHMGPIWAPNGPTWGPWGPYGPQMGRGGRGQNAGRQESNPCMSPCPPGERCVRVPARLIPGGRSSRVRGGLDTNGPRGAPSPPTEGGSVPAHRRVGGAGPGPMGRPMGRPCAHAMVGPLCFCLNGDKRETATWQFFIC